MKLKNNALRELYDTIVNGTMTISPYAESPFDKAFRECDEKIQSDIDIWKCGNEILHSANMDLVNYKRNLEKEIDGLKEHVLENHKIIADIGSERDALEKERDDLLGRTHHAEDAVEDLKKECKTLHDRNVILKNSYDTAVSAVDEAINEKKELEDNVKQLKKDLDDAKNQLNYCTHSRDNWRARAKYAEDEVERLREAHDELFDAGSRKISELRREYEAVNKKLEEEVEELKETLEKANGDLADAKVRLHFLTRSRDDWKSRVEHAEDEVEDLKKEVNHLTEELSAEMKAKSDWPNMLLEKGKTIASLEEQLMELKETLEKANSDRTELQNDRDFYHGLYTELRKDYNKLFEDIKQIKKELHTAEEARNNLRAELEAKVKRMDEITKDRDFFFKQYHALKNDYEKLEAKYRDMKSYSNCYAEGYSDGKEEGEENLWDMLQNVNDSQPYDFDAECDGMEDVISMDLEVFLDSYKNWQEEKETDRMRKWLADFCDGRLCKECPLGSTEFKCGCGYSFRKRDRFDTRIIPDEDIKRYYEKARGCGRYTLKDDPCNGVREKIKDACDAFYNGIKAGLASEVKEVPVSCGIPIKDLASWECTIEATVEVNKDILKVVCGIKDDKK